MVTDKSQVQIHVNNIQNKFTLKIKTAYYLELLTPEYMKLLGSNETKITEGRNGEKRSHLEITEVVLVHCNIVNNQHSIIQESYGHLLQITNLAS